MFHSFFIVTESGICIFEQHFRRKSRVDSQLISGFINALGAFSVEALGSGMQSLQLQTGEHLYIYPYKKISTVGLVGIVIADSRDNSYLVKKILHQILDDFSMIFEKNLQTGSFSEITPYKEFRYNVTSILEGRIATRTRLKMILGVFVGLLIVGLIIASLIPMFIKLSTANIADLGLPPIDFSDNLSAVELQTIQAITLVIIGALMVFFLVVYFFPTFISAYIAGNRRRGIWAALLLGISIGTILLIATFTGPPTGELSQVNAFLWYITFSPLLISLSLLAGIYGGRLKERRKLYPLDEYQEKIL